MREKILRNETLVEIIGADESAPVNTMYDLIGKKGRITDYSDDGHYKILDWWWSPLDFIVLKGVSSDTEFLFDAKNLVIGDSL